MNFDMVYTRIGSLMRSKYRHCSADWREEMQAEAIGLAWKEWTRKPAATVGEVNQMAKCAVSHAVKGECVQGAHNRDLGSELCRHRHGVERQSLDVAGYVAESRDSIPDVVALKIDAEEFRASLGAMESRLFDLGALGFNLTESAEMIGMSRSTAGVIRDRMAKEWEEYAA